MTAADDALDRLERWACPNADAPGHSGCSYCADHHDALATVRDYIHAIRADRDGAVDLVVSQEAELQRLREERDSQDWYTEWYAPMKRRAEAAEAEVQRLTEGLRNIAKVIDRNDLADAFAALLANSPPDRPPPWECLEPNLPDGGGAK